MKRTPLNRRKPLRSHTRLRPRARKPKAGTVEDAAFLAFVHQQDCMVHGRNCPPFVGAIPNRLEAHHIDHSHKNARRVVPLCLAAHQYSERKPSREEMEREVARLNALWERRIAA